MKISMLIILCCIAFVSRGQLMKEPEVDSLKRASFTLAAPKANEVKLINLSDKDALGANEYSFIKNDDGNWELTTKPCRPGLHYFEISIDGARVSYPNAHMYFGWAKWTSMIEIPDDKLVFYLPKNVPHGEVRQHYYYSEITKNTRKCLVYTPPGYDASHETYPVLYLQHGSGESELGWTMQGKVNYIMDNLLAEGKATPFIIVMDNGYAPHLGANNQFTPNGADNLFTNLVCNELMPIIDSGYRTKTSKENRAIAGLSMGGGQAMQIGFSHPELFGTVATFSGAVRNFDIETSYNGIFKNADKFNQTFNLFFIGCGTLESYYEGMNNMNKKLKAHNIKTVFSEPVGSHEWQVWRIHFCEFAQQVFK